MGSYEDFYENSFGGINIGDEIKIYKEGQTYTGTLIFKNEHYITVQLPYYREGFSMLDFYTGHAKIAGVRGEDFDIEMDDVINDEDEFGDEDIDMDAFEDDE